MPIHDSSRLIKARSARHIGAAATFNFDDLRRQCDEYIASASRQGEQLLSEAAAAASEVRRQAHAEGFAAGQREGLASSGQIVETQAAEMAARQTQEQLRTLLPAFHAAVQALQIERDRWLSTWETAAVRLAAVMAEKILRHELSRRPELAVAIVREALELAAGQPHVKLHLHPRDLDQLQEIGQEIVGRLAASGEATLIPDESLSRGGCLIETRHGVIDARLETQLARITHELLEES